jgi:hypothetical protein
MNVRFHFHGGAGPASANPVLHAVIRDGSSARPSSPRSRPMSSSTHGKKTEQEAAY